MLKTNLKLKIIFVGLIFSCFPALASALSIGEKTSFFVDSSYDLQGRQQISAELEKVSNQIYFYVDENWINNLDPQSRAKIPGYLDSLTAEFENKIYPTLTSNFGSEWIPGIDNDTKITVLIHPMIKEAGGYFNSADEYPKIQIPKSNQREMFYLNASLIGDFDAKSYLAHEFMHLITFNQKDNLRKITDETWLNETYSEFAISFLGYNNTYENSNLQQRVQDFLGKTNDSLTEWQNDAADYGIVDIFSQYLVDHYGAKILIDALHSSKIGIASINEALSVNSYKDDFSQVFTNWTIAVLVNDCSLGDKYCYLNPNLKSLRVIPMLNFLPLVGDSSLSLTHRTTNWAGNWQKITGGKGSLSFEFHGADVVKFRIPYLLCDYQNKCSVGFLNLDSTQNAKLVIADFSSKYASMTIIPSIQSKISGFDGDEPFYIFSWKVSATDNTNQQSDAELRAKLLSQIDFLQKEIARIQSQINLILAGKGTAVCGQLKNELYSGLTNNQDVRCLQEFLKSQGTTIYPEGLVTGNFLAATKSAVIRFQEKYASEILFPSGLQKGTGYVGQATLNKINQLSHT